MSADPHSIEAERAVLGIVMVDPTCMAEVGALLTREDFYRDAHGHLFDLLLEMQRRDMPTEMAAVAEVVMRAGREDQVGGLAYVASLPDQVPSTTNVGHYAKLVADRAAERRLLATFRRGQELITQGTMSAAEVIDAVQQDVFSVTVADAKPAVRSLGEVVHEEYTRVMDLVDNPGDVVGMTTGLTDLDRLLLGLHRTDLVILAARPAMGKTALAVNVGRAVAASGVGVGVFSLEMSAGQLVTRLLVERSSVYGSKFRTGRMDRDRDVPRVADAAEGLMALPMHIDDTPGLSIEKLQARARRMKQAHPGIGLFIVDYIGLMQGDARVSRQEQIAQASRGLKLLAKELDVCVLALSQLNRKVEDRNPKIPQLADLRESGAIEQDADVIMFIYRDDYYNPDTTTRPGVADIIVAKHRQGPTDTVCVVWQGEFLRFSDLAQAPPE